MKKLLTLILAVLYVGTSTGATLHMHYCMGELVDVALWHDEARPCSKCASAPGDACSKDCCKDVHKTVKLEKDQKRVEFAFAFLHWDVAATALPACFSHTVRPILQDRVVPVGHAPLRSQKVLTHVLHCTFRI